MAGFWTILASIAAFAGVILVTATHYWGELDSAAEVETWIDDRLLDRWINGGECEIGVKRVVVNEKSEWKGWVNRYLLFEPTGGVKIIVEVRGEDISAHTPWTPEQFEEYREIHEMDADWEYDRREGRARHRLELNTLDKKEIYDFVRGLSTVPYIEMEENNDDAE